MKIYFYLINAVIIFIVFNFIFEIYKNGDLFNVKALKKSLNEAGRTLWLGMRLFVVFWFLYLLLNWWLRTKRGLK
jgi:hypothetical protein